MRQDFFKDKVALITGSTLGIGKTLAFTLARAGARVVINGRNKERLDRVEQEMLEEGLSVLAVIGDVTNPDDCEQLIKASIQKFQRIDFLLLMAGLSMNGRIVELQPVVFKNLMETNYLGSVYPLLKALPYLRASMGSVVFASSVAGMIGFPRFSAYSSSKMSLTGLAESLHCELSGEGMHVGIIYISFVQNEPEKRIMAPDGSLVEKKEMDKSMKYDSHDKVVGKIIDQLRKRKFSCNYSIYGKGTRFMKFFFPSVFLSLVKRNYQKSLMIK